MEEYNGFNQISIKDKLKEIWYKYKKYIIISVCIIITLIIVLSIIFKQDRVDNTNLKYQSIETVMKLNAEKFVKNNNVTKDMYLSLNNLNLKIDNELDCSSISGVLKEKNNYYPYLVCKGYNSNTIKEVLENNEQNKQYGTLKGDNPYILTSGEYQEPGYDVDSKYTVNIKGNDIENGINIISYYILENNQYVTELKRIVIAEDIQGNEPVIELVGNKTRTIPQNSLYKETGFKATDKIDGDITDKVQTIGIVDTSKPGTYTITYQVTNSKNKTTTITRTIIVNQTEVTLDITHTINPTTVTGTGVTITLDIKGDGYAKTITPTNDEVTTRNPSITIYKNGTYEFTIFDTIGNSEVYEVKIINASIFTLNGECQATIDNNQITFTNNITSNHDIKHYIYKTETTKSTATKEKTYITNGTTQTASIEIEDIYGNKKEQKCKVSELYDHYIITGDSRTCGLRAAVKSYATNTSFVDKSGSRYSWFSGEAVGEITSLLNRNNYKHYIYIFFGVNDIAGNLSEAESIEKANTYLDRVNGLIENQWKGHKVVFISVNPVNEARLGHYRVKNYSINAFNEKIKSGLSKNGYYCDTATPLGEQLQSMTNDGLHYSSKGSKLIYDYVIKNCRF